MEAQRVLLNAEPMERAMEADETARALDFFRDASFRTSSTGNVGVGAETSPDDLDLRRRCITESDGYMYRLDADLASKLADSSPRSGRGRRFKSMHMSSLSR